jgi:hypothetical protein
MKLLCQVAAEFQKRGRGNVKKRFISARRNLEVAREEVHEGSLIGSSFLVTPCNGVRLVFFVVDSR